MAEQDIPYMLQAPTDMPPPQTQPTVPVSPPSYNRSGMPFNIPILGTILDTGRDLLVGPGNENLTTQEQVTRAILNSIVLAKAPQALGDIHANNAARDRVALSSLSDPQFRSFVDDYHKTAGLSEEDAIKAAAAKVRIPTGFALPKSIAELPPVDPAAKIAYTVNTNKLEEAEHIMDRDLSQQPNVGQGVDPATVQRARLYNFAGVRQFPGGERIVNSLEAQANAAVPNPMQPRMVDGQLVDAITGQPVAPPPGMSGLPTPVGAPPTSESLPFATAEQPMTIEQAPPKLSESSHPGELNLTQPDENPVDTEGNPLPSPRLGVSRWKLSKEYDPNNKNWFQFLERKSDDEFNREVKVQQDEIAKFYDNYEATKAKIYDERRKTTSEIEEVKLNAEALVKNLLKYAVTPDGKPNLNVWSQDKRHQFSRAGIWEGIKYVAYQGFRGSPFGQNVDFPDVADDTPIALFVGDKGVAAQMLARVITKDRVSDQDYITFAKKLPLITDTREVAEAKIRNLDKAILDIYKTVQSRKADAEADLNLTREKRIRNPEPIGRARTETLSDTPPAAGSPSPRQTPRPQIEGWD